jgi:hypothetical protein
MFLWTWHDFAKKKKTVLFGPRLNRQPGLIQGVGYSAEDGIGYSSGTVAVLSKIAEVQVSGSESPFEWCMQRRIYHLR